MVAINPMRQPITEYVNSFWQQKRERDQTERQQEPSGSYRRSPVEEWVAPVLPHNTLIGVWELNRDFSLPEGLLPQHIYSYTAWCFLLLNKESRNNRALPHPPGVSAGSCSSWQVSDSGARSTYWFPSSGSVSWTPSPWSACWTPSFISIAMECLPQ